MSKTAEELGMIIGGIALAAVPGLQAAGLIAIEGHATLMSAMLGVGVSMALSGIGMALQPPLKPVLGANSISPANAISYRRAIYGQFQTAGVLTYASFPPSQNQATTSQFLHLIYTLAGHEISSFDAVIIDGTVYNFASDISENSSLPNTPWQIQPDASVVNNDFYWQHMFFEFDAGKPGNGAQPFPNLQSVDPAWGGASGVGGGGGGTDGVTSVAVTAGGHSYGGTPTVSFSGGGGSGATAIAEVAPGSGQVTAVYVTNSGSGYTSAPTVSFSGGGGSGAAATATIGPVSGGGGGGGGGPVGPGNCLQQGCAKVHVILRADSAETWIYPSGQIPNIQFLVTGKKLIDPRIITAWQASASYTPYGYIVDNNGVIWFNSNSSSGVTGSTRPDFEDYSNTLGTTLTDGSVTWFNTAYPLAAVYNGNTAAPQLSGRRLVNDGWPASFAYSGAGNELVIEAPIGYLQILSTVGTTGTSYPNFSTAVSGTTTDGTCTWHCLGRSTHALNPSNPALVVNDYLQDSDYGMGTSAASIDTASVIAAANVCEEQELIIWNADGTKVYENLYSSNGMFDQSSTRGNVLGALCGSMAGWVIPPGDQWHVFAGAYITPTVSLTDNDLRGPIKGDFRLSKREVANSIKGTYVPAYLPASPAAAISLTVVPGTWHSQSYPPYQANGLAGKPNYLNTEDAGEVIWQDANFEFTTSVWTAQRLAKIALMRLRFQETLTLSCKLTAFALEAGDTFYFTHSRWGITSGVYEALQCSIVLDNPGKDSA
ncbi:MAG TPA: hypothetical protein VGS05_09850, partial [Candidatus Sulfotelmatobacter sp.]|nr:hypothetical protein [Candidatus Sulfotelmatobacter sp.]